MFRSLHYPILHQRRRNSDYFLRPAVRMAGRLISSGRTLVIAVNPTWIFRLPSRQGCSANTLVPNEGLRVSELVSITRRGAERVNMFLAATAYFDGSSNPARVRNLSTWGAMLDAGVVPAIDTHVQISRGQLNASGTVVRVNGSRFGVSLAHPIEVSRWLSPPRNPGQETVDRIFRNPAEPPSLPSDPLMNGEVTGRTSYSVAALDEVIDLLASLGDRLSDDATVVGQHGEALQNLDRALQILGRLKTSV